MARIRYLKPEFFIDEDLKNLPYEARLFFAGLWCHADKAGRLEDRPERLKVQIMPYDKIDPEKILTLLSSNKSTGKPYINRYSVNGSKYIQILQWENHQKPHHTEKDSVIPPFNGELTVNIDVSNSKETITVKEPLNKGRVRDAHSPSPSPFSLDLKGGVGGFKPPTIEEVKSYCIERKNGVDPQKWHDFYSAKGWMIGKNKMKDWEAAVRTWEKKPDPVEPKKSDLEYERTKKYLSELK